jgi:hypothetical protein
VKCPKSARFFTYWYAISIAALGRARGGGKDAQSATGGRTVSSRTQISRGP